MQNAKKLTKTKISINKYFSQESLECRKKLGKEIKQLQSEAKRAYLRYRTINDKGMIDIINIIHYVIRKKFY